MTHGNRKQQLRFGSAGWRFSSKKIGKFAFDRENQEKVRTSFRQGEDIIMNF